MQERAAGSPPLTAWLLLFLGLVGILLGLIQAPGVLDIGTSNETDVEGTPEEDGGAAGTPTGTAEASGAGGPGAPLAAPAGVPPSAGAAPG